MNLSKSVVILVMAVVFMMMASFVSAAPPTVSVSGVPSNVVGGTSFKVTATGSAASAPAGQTVTTLSLASSNANFSVSSPASVSCTSGSATCVAEFSVDVAAGSPLGSGATLTATAVASSGEVGSATASSTVSGSPTVGDRPPIRIDEVELDGFSLSTSSTTTRDLERGGAFDLKVRLTALADVQDVEIRAFVSGADVAKSDDISDETGNFNVERGVSYVKTLSLRLPERADEDRYRIHVIVSGRNTEAISQDFRIKVTPTDHEIVIRELSITPEDTVKAGSVIVAAVRVKNIGDRTEDDVKIRVSIPELGVTDNPDFIDELESDDSATSEQFYLRVGACVRPGTYDVKAEVTFDDGDGIATAKKSITVTKGACEGGTAGPAAVSAGGVKLAYSPDAQAVQAGGAAVAYPLTIMNEGTSTKTYTVSVSSADWASVQLSPGNVVTVKPGDSQTVFVFVSAKSGAAPGAQSFVVRIKDQAGDVLKELPMSANVVAGGAVAAGDLVQLMQLGLIALIVVLVIVGVVVAFRRMKGPGEGGEGAQTYY